MASQASILISQLQAKGYSKAAIAKAISRDSSIISQIAAGKKSGASYIPALEKLTGGAPSVTVERRKTKAGTTARVRGGAIRDESNRVINEVSKTPDGAHIQSLINKVEKQDGRIGAVVTFKRYQAYDMPYPTTMDIPIWSNGSSAKWVNSTMRETGMSFSQLLTQQVKKAYEPLVAEGVIAVQINVVY